MNSDQADMIKNSLRRAWPRLRKIGLAVLVGVAALGLLGFFAAPPLVKSLLADKLGAALHRPVSIEKLSINPYALSLTVEGLAVKEASGAQDFLSFERLHLNLDASSLLRFAPVIGEASLVNPRITIVRFADRRYNFSDLVDAFLAQPKSEGKPLSFALRNVKLSGGAIAFDDQALAEKHLIDEMTIGVPFASNIGEASEGFVEPLFSARVDGATFAVKGRSKLFASSRESEITLALDRLELAKYVDYLPLKLPVKLASGALDIDLKIAFRQEKDQPSTLAVSGKADLNDLKITEASGAPLVSAKAIGLALAEADLLARKIFVERLRIDTPVIDGRVDRKGLVSWAEFVAAVQGAGEAPKASAAAAPLAQTPWQWSIGEIEVARGQLRWLDESGADGFSASVDAIDLNMKKLGSTGEAADFTLGAKIAAGDALKVEAIALKGGRLDLAKKELTIGEASLRGARSAFRRSEGGSIEWLRMPVQAAAQGEAAEPAPPWKVVVDKVIGEAISLRFEDRTVAPAALQAIDDLGFEATHLSSLPGETAQLAARFNVNGKGSVAIGGSVKAQPLAADLRLDLKRIEILPLQPYFAQKLNIAVTRGQANLSGTLQLAAAAPPSAGKTSVEGASEALLPGFAGAFNGQASIVDFYAVDKIEAADFLRWKSLRVDKIGIRLAPDAITVGDVALADFFARVVVSAAGQLNLMHIVRSADAGAASVVAQTPEQAAATQAEKAAKEAKEANVAGAGKASAPLPEKPRSLMPIRVARIGLTNGSVRFTDNFVKPNYSASFRDIAGSVSGLSSEPGTVAALELAGNYDTAPLKLTASINPLSAKPYLDLQADVKGVEMTAFSAYSGKYAGYAIEKGKLSLFVKYKIENDILTAENRVFLDQLTFGDPVDSPDATKLPVRLAVSLLKNRNGEIDLNLPISGSLNDPQFSVGGLIIKVIVNLFVKAVTSPFALIGSMFGGGEELSTVDFDAGRATVLPAAEKRLETLARALIDRPALRLEVEGRYDAERDPDGLKKARLERKLRALKREDLAKSGGASEGEGAGAALAISAQEYPALLERAYKNEKFAKPRNVIGLAKSLPVAEMEALMLANSPVEPDDLRELGERRAKAVREWLLAHEVPAERVFLLPAKAAQGEGKSESGSRVDFALK